MTMNHYLPLHHWVPDCAGSKDQTKNLMQGKVGDGDGDGDGIDADIFHTLQEE